MYTLNYTVNGNVGSIQKGNMCIPICEGNADYNDFIIWNSQQEIPFDLNSTYTPTPEEIKATEDAALATANAEAVAKLEEIDLKSIRGIREWIALQPDAPKFTLDLEAEAVTERSKLTTELKTDITVEEDILP